MSEKSVKKPRPSKADLSDDRVRLECDKSWGLTIYVRQDGLNDDVRADMAEAGWKYTTIRLWRDRTSLARFIAVLIDRYNEFVDEDNDIAAQVKPLKPLHKLPTVKTDAA